MLASETRSAILCIGGLPRARRRLCCRGKMKEPSASFGSSEAYQNVHGLPPKPPYGGKPARLKRLGCAPGGAAAGPLRGHVGLLPCSPGGGRGGGWGRPGAAAG